MCLAFGLQNGVLSKAHGIGFTRLSYRGRLTRLSQPLVQAGYARRDSGGHPNLRRERYRFGLGCVCAGVLYGSLMISHIGPKGNLGMPLLLIGVLFDIVFSVQMGIHDTK